MKIYMLIVNMKIKITCMKDDLYVNVFFGDFAWTYTDIGLGLMTEMKIILNAHLGVKIYLFICELAMLLFKKKNLIFKIVTVEFLTDSTFSRTDTLYTVVYYNTYTKYN